VHAAERFRRGEGPVELGAIARALDVDRGVVAECVAKLCNAGTLAAIDDDKEGYVLARDPETIGLSLLAEQFGGARSLAGADPRVGALLAKIEDQRCRWLARQTLADLLAVEPLVSAPGTADEPAAALVVRSAGERA
jgi:DNA-binding IscR family transcriptional regulator